MLTKQYIDQLYEITNKHCDHPFDESEIFSDITKVEVKDKFITYFHNISRILDCVECEVCKVYSKLQTYGIAAALKILFSEKLGGASEVNLKRNELIALVNTFNKFSTSLEYIDRMFMRKRNYYFGMTGDIVVALLFLVGSTWLLYKSYKDKVSRVTGQIKTECNYEKKLK
jgi:ERO1-like protein alpha